LIEGLLKVSGVSGVIHGQATEMVAPPDSLASLLEIFRRKTGSLFRACLSLPSIARGLDASAVKILAELGDGFGIAFQIADDLEDDFTVQAKNAGHLAAYSSADEGRKLAGEILTTAFHAAIRGTDIDISRIGERLTPFVEELMQKLLSTAGKS
jgi:geranylgeranyl pyrophosphate synthase